MTWRHVMQIPWEDVDIVVITHADADHANALSHFQSRCISSHNWNQDFKIFIPNANRYLFFPIKEAKAKQSFHRPAEKLSSPEYVAPPIAAAKFLHLLPKRYRESMLGDMEEDFHKYVHQFGPEYARKWYWWQVASAVLYGLARLVVKVFGWRWIGS